MKPFSGLKPAQFVVPLVCAALAGCHSRSEVTVAAKPPATNEYHGVQVIDEYQWLENPADSDVHRWTSERNQHARAALDSLPTRPYIEDRLTRLLTERSPNYSSLTWRKGKLFLLKFEPPAQQPVLITLTSVTNLDSEKIVLDPNQLSTNGTTAIDWFVPSHDGKLVAVSLSQNGSEDGTLSVYETDTGQKLPDIIPRVHGPTAGGSAAWNADGTGLFYTRYPRKGERPEPDLSFYQQVYFHKLGTPEQQDRYELGKDFPRIAEIRLESRTDGEYLLATVANGDGGEYAHYVRPASGDWRQITHFDDQIKQAEFGRDPLYIEYGKDDALYLLSRRDAPNGKILRLPFAETELSKAKTVFPEGTNVIQDFRPSASGLYVVLMHGGPSELLYKDYFEKTNRIIRGTLERVPTTFQELVLAQGDELLFRTITYTEPYAWWRYNPTSDRDRVQFTPLIGKSPASFGDIEVVRSTVISKDGTKIPLNIIEKKGTRHNGENPTILTGYGGYNISLAPNFDVSRRIWLDQGGVIAIANLRGGGEFGESWHKAGSLTNKQHVFDDFAACAEFLIRSNYTKPSRLAIQGGSNGGLLMGALLTQRPDLISAVVSHVGIYDMLRVELDPNGAFNTTEFGSVKDPEQFKALYAYSPYHHVQRTNYPAVLMLTGEHDGRVNPAHSRKMIARLESSTTSGRPVLLRTSSSTGHGIGTALGERIQQLVDVYSFLFDQLGIDYSIIDRGPWSGGVTPNFALVKAKLIRPGMTARLLLSKSPSLSDPNWSPYAHSEAAQGNVVAFPLPNLEPDTRYHYALEVDGHLEAKKSGEFRTFPHPGPASFKIAWASCAKTGSASDIFDRIRENDPLIYMNVGDFHYQDIRTNDINRFRAAYDAVLASPEQADLYRHVAFDYIWDDHDFGGNGATRKASTHEAARRSYEEYVPHYPLLFDREGPIAHSFTIGRAKFILTDLRSQRDDPRTKESPEKSMMGPEQKEWFKKELLDANGKYPLICWVSSVPWIGKAGTNVYRAVGTNIFGYIHHTNLAEMVRTNRNRGRGSGEDGQSSTNRNRFRGGDGDSGGNTNRNRFRGGRGGGGIGDEDHWSVFATERREIADFIKSNHISGVCILHGDSHMLAADDGTYSDYATGGGAPIPVMCAAPLEQNPSLKGGPYSQGVYRVREREGEGGFGLLFVEDRGDHIDVAYSGRNNKNEEKISLKFSVPASKPVAQR